MLLLSPEVFSEKVKYNCDMIHVLNALIVIRYLFIEVSS